LNNYRTMPMALSWFSVWMLKDGIETWADRWVQDFKHGMLDRDELVMRAKTIDEECDHLIAALKISKAIDVYVQDDVIADLERIKDTIHDAIPAQSVPE